MKTKYLYCLVIAPVVLVLDQLSKAIIVFAVGQGDSIPVIPGLFDIVHYRNKGAAFGLLSGWDSAYRELFFYVLSFFALVFLIYYFRALKDDDRLGVIPLSLIFGGALGNILDRIGRGSVVDFLSFHWYDRVVEFRLIGYHVEVPLVWPAFNVGDSAITVGVIWLIIGLMLEKRPK